ncbi:hypothetical protein MHK_002289 [Candidatus Magnetomorum sp. HK-1]|nr:hypothetical protein MHK_002289 [Candidatus Magnetomorum sp. HK-1]
MPVTYTNKKRKKYYLHHGKTKTGKTKYHFLMKDNGNLVEKIPEDFEIYEHPSNAQVFLRKKQIKIITDIENHLVNKYLKKIKSSYSYISDIKGKVITIFESNQNNDAIRDVFNKFSIGLPKSDSFINEIIDTNASYSPVMRFILLDKKQRIFTTERFCFRGSVDDWISISEPDSLEKLLKTFIKHLGKESLFDIY